MKTLPIVVTSGEPAGIGPDVTISALSQDWPVEIILVADPELIRERALKLNQNVNLSEWQSDAPSKTHQARQIKILPVQLKKPVTAGQLAVENAQYVIESLKKAADLCLRGKAKALVTAPVHKGILNEAGFTFSGHTEFLAALAKVPQTVMLFVTEELKVALVTTHLPLRAVPDAITAEKLTAIIKIVANDLKQKFSIEKPRILVAGLNPHAGEMGHLGNEEQLIISPVIKHMQNQGYAIEGPFPADTLFATEKLSNNDVILAMYHDQALPVVKYLGFGNAVNVTLGLPFVRTSVDHGTALPLAGSGRAESESMKKAIEWGIRLTDDR